MCIYFIIICEDLCHEGYVSYWMPSPKSLTLLNRYVADSGSCKQKSQLDQSKHLVPDTLRSSYHGRDTAKHNRNKKYTVELLENKDNLF